MLRKLFAKFRLSSHDLAIETVAGRAQKFLEMRDYVKNVRLPLKMKFMFSVNAQPTMKVEKYY